MNEGMSRRGFLGPAGLADAADRLRKDLSNSLDSLERLANEPLVTLRRPAMACNFEFQFGIGEPDRKSAVQIFDLIDRLEDQMTVYRDTSEIVRLNRLAAREEVTVEPLLFRLLERCRLWTDQTDGAFDITSGPLIRTWGFLHRQGRVPTDVEIEHELERVGMSHVHLDEARKTIRFDRPGVELNLGGVGKGYALDRAAQRFRAAGYRGVMLSAGHSSVLAVGHPSYDDAWQVGVRDPRGGDQNLVDVRLSNLAISTSGIAQQSFEQGGRRYGHLLDPRIGRPASGVLQATAVANSAAYAEALSTAFFVNGLEWARQFCSRNPEVGAILVPEAADRCQIVGAVAVKPNERY